MNKAILAVVGVVVVAGAGYYAMQHKTPKPDVLHPVGADASVGDKNQPAPTPSTQGVLPTVSTTETTSIGSGVANINGKINPNGLAVSYWFEYGTTAKLGTVTKTQTKPASNIVSLAGQYLTNLKSKTTYYYRIVAKNDNGISLGEIMKFTTR